jgi:hypothetical protein
MKTIADMKDGDILTGLILDDTIKEINRLRSGIVGGLSTRDIANSAWNDLNFALSLIPNGQAYDLVFEARSKIDTIVKRG